MYFQKTKKKTERKTCIQFQILLILTCNGHIEIAFNGKTIDAKFNKKKQENIRKENNYTEV